MAITAPAALTRPSDLTKLVSKNRQRIHASPTSSKQTTMIAVTIAAW